MDNSVKNSEDKFKGYVIDFDLIDNRDSSKEAKNNSHQKNEEKQVASDFNFDKPRFHAQRIN